MLERGGGIFAAPKCCSCFGNSWWCSDTWVTKCRMSSGPVDSSEQKRFSHMLLLRSESGWSEVRVWPLLATRVWKSDLFAWVRIHVRNISRHGVIATKASGLQRGLLLFLVLFYVAPRQQLAPHPRPLPTFRTWESPAWRDGSSNLTGEKSRTDSPGGLIMCVL